MTKKFKAKTFRAFTLAEVLITLGIIGVVASITIPTLIKNTQDAEFKTKMKKGFSVLSQATMSLASDNGGTIPTYGTYDQFMSAYSDYLSYIKVCYQGDTSCSTGNGNDYKTYSGAAWPGGWPFDAGRAAGVLKDGTVFYFAYLGIAQGWRITDRQNCIGHVIIDTNGAKGPNQTTKDIWELLIGNDGRVVPMGSAVDAFRASQSTTFGYTAALTDLFN